MKEKILKLRNEGLSYRAIQDKLGCSKSLIAYYCSPNYKNNLRDKTKKWRADNKETYILEGKVNSFSRRVRGFRNNKMLEKDSLTSKEATEILNNQGYKCYLTGDKLNLLDKNSVHFDHKIPTCKGGKSTKENLGICTRSANLAKNDLSVDEFLELCKKVLQYNGYKVAKLNAL